MSRAAARSRVGRERGGPGRLEGAYTVVDVGSPILLRDPLTSKGLTKFYIECSELRSTRTLRRF